MGQSEEDCFPTQLIDGKGEFNVEGLDTFVKKTKLSDSGLSYAVVAIMGPQSSGLMIFLSFFFGIQVFESFFFFVCAANCLIIIVLNLIWVIKQGRVHF